MSYYFTGTVLFKQVPYMQVSTCTYSCRIQGGCAPWILHESRAHVRRIVAPTGATILLTHLPQTGDSQAFMCPCIKPACVSVFFFLFPLVFSFFCGGSDVVWRLKSLFNFVKGSCFFYVAEDLVGRGYSREKLYCPPVSQPRSEGVSR